MDKLANVADDTVDARAAAGVVNAVFMDSIGGDLERLPSEAIAAVLGELGSVEAALLTRLDAGAPAPALAACLAPDARAYAWLGALLADPTRVAEVPAEQIPGLLAAVQGALAARLFTSPPAALTAGAPAPAPEADRLVRAREAARVAGSGLLTQKDAAAFLAVSPRSLEGWRVRGGGPRFIRVGRAVRYRREDLEQYLSESTRRSTSEDAAAQADGATREGPARRSAVSRPSIVPRPRRPPGGATGRERREGA